MRFTCEKNMLVTGLNIAGRTVAQKSSLSVIEGILCKAGQGLSLTGYNMETAITYEIDADVSDMGQCILPAKLFGDIIRRLPEGPVTVVVDENYKVSIRAGYASFTISAESAEDYPELPDVGDGREIYIPQNKLKELISGTIFAVSENQGRPIHTGVKFEVTNDSITAVAVDGFRLARRTFHPEEGTGRELNFVVPAAGLKEVEKILTDVEDNAAFTLGTKHILFQVGNATLVCRLLEGEFLDWRRVVPSNCPIKMVANVGDLASSVERVGLIVSEKYKSPVRCMFGSQLHRLLLPHPPDDGVFRHESLCFRLHHRRGGGPLLSGRGRAGAGDRLQRPVSGGSPAGDPLGGGHAGTDKWVEPHCSDPRGREGRLCLYGAARPDQERLSEGVGL